MWFGNGTDIGLDDVYAVLFYISHIAPILCLLTCCMQAIAGLVVGLAGAVALFYLLVVVEAVVGVVEDFCGVFLL